MRNTRAPNPRECLLAAAGTAVERLPPASSSSPRPMRGTFRSAPLMESKLPSILKLVSPSTAVDLRAAGAVEGLLPCPLCPSLHRFLLLLSWVAVCRSWCRELPAAQQVRILVPSTYPSPRSQLLFADGWHSARLPHTGVSSNRQLKLHSPLLCLCCAGLLLPSWMHPVIL